MSDPTALSARDQLRALDRGEVSSRELTAAHLEAIAAHPERNAVITVDEPGALAAAEAADARRARGGLLPPLLGLPMTVKDSLETAGLRTTCGSPGLADHVPERDADAVALLRTAGAVLMGKTNVPPMCQDIQTGNTRFGSTRNPHDPTRTAGGSSGGAAAAVATRLTPWELGSDLAGSVRLPAHYCGTYGLRTSGGIVPTRGHIPRPPGAYSSTDMTVLGPLTRTADDLDLALDVLVAPRPGDQAAWRLDLPGPRHTTLGDYRVGVWADDPHCPVSAETRALLDQVAEELRHACDRVDDTTRPVEMATSDRLFTRLLFAGTSAGTDENTFNSAVKAAEERPEHPFLRAQTMRHREWLLADEDRQSLRARWAEYFRHVDVLVTPAAPTEAVLDQTGMPMSERHITVDGARRGYWEQTAWLNLAGLVGLPAATVPLSSTSDGLPLGVQIIGPCLEDRTVTHFAGLLTARTH
ncbi:amidase [Streptomyces armeniacus]|uniref:Amidase n=1 Tax=Streptomyces armeniacus TaxID=83291 RepID=A0A345XM83_9ACTN|nr:amidase [Streptomyces armeniacus]AXK32749.1 amidase [Streptomyces armeniacus]